jgi:AcrR family transcriptional regulator
MVAGTDRVLRADARANREAVLSAATTLYVEHGVDVPFEDIAQRAGVGRATMYRHFPTRDALLLAMLEQLVAELEDVAADIPQTPSGFFRLFRAAVRLQVDNLPLVQLLPPVLPEGVDRLRDRIDAVYRRPLDVAKTAGTVRPGLSTADVRVLVSMLSAVIRPQTSEADRRRALRLARTALEPDACAS